MSDWRVLRLAVPAAQADVVEQVMEDQGALSITMTDALDNPLFEPPPGARPLWPLVQIEAIFGQDDDSDLTRASCQNALGYYLGDAAPTIAIENLEDRDWTRLWMDSFQPMRFGRRLWIVPSWHPCPEPDHVNLRIDPGLAFGTGTHPTTSLCLQWLDAQPSMPDSCLDYGCGSGVLAIAALLLGCKQAQGTDIDPQAVTATLDNAQRNDLSARMQACLVEDFSPSATYPLVMANILSGPLIELSPVLNQHLAHQGTLVLSGLLAEQAQDVMDAYPDVRFDPPVELDGWCRLTGIKIR